MNVRTLARHTAARRTLYGHPDRDRRKAHELTSLRLCVTPHPIHKHVASGAEHCRRVCRTVVTDVETEGLKAAQVVHLMVSDQVPVPVHIIVRCGAIRAIDVPAATPAVIG